MKYKCALSCWDKYEAAVIACIIPDKINVTIKVLMVNKINVKIKFTLNNENLVALNSVILKSIMPNYMKQKYPEM